ncbi:unnamed protein product [Fusarium graminearum]|nr:unnamed protein product [Fusarium graminearum]
MNLRLEGDAKKKEEDVCVDSGSKLLSGDEPINPPRDTTFLYLDTYTEVPERFVTGEDEECVVYENAIH